MAEPHFAVQHFDVEHLKKQASVFADALSAYLAEQGDATGLKVSNLREMAHSLKMHLEQIDSLLAIADHHPFDDPQWPRGQEEVDEWKATPPEE